MQDGLVTGPGGAPITMESGRSNTLRGLHHSPSKHGSPSKIQLTVDDREKGRFRKKGADGKPLQNFRASSEPPSEIGLHYMHSQEDLKVNMEMVGAFQQREE